MKKIIIILIFLPLIFSCSKPNACDTLLGSWEQGTDYKMRITLLFDGKQFVMRKKLWGKSDELGEVTDSLTGSCDEMKAKWNIRLDTARNLLIMDDSEFSRVKH